MPGRMPARRGALMGLTSSCTSESLYKVSHLRRYGRRYEKSNVPKRAPGSLRENFSAPVTFCTLKKLFRNVWIVIGSVQGSMLPVTELRQPWPLPPQMAVRSNPNSRFSVGLKLSFSPCIHGEFG